MKRNYDECVTKYSDSFVRVVLDPGYVSRIQNFVTELVEAKSKEDHHKIDSNKEVKRFTTGFLGEAALEKLFGIRDDFIDAMKKYGRMYPDAGYGGRFGSWIFSDNREPYNSYGNGSAMRVSPCAWIMDCGFCTRTGMWPSNGRARVQLSAEVTHNHPEGVKGAMATADAIRNAISLGGDSDTLAAITGSIAEAAYGIPDWIKGEAYSYLDEPLKDVLRRWKKFISKD